MRQENVLPLSANHVKAVEFNFRGSYFAIIWVILNAGIWAFPHFEFHSQSRWCLFHPVKYSRDSNPFCFFTAKTWLVTASMIPTQNNTIIINTILPNFLPLMSRGYSFWVQREKQPKHYSRIHPHLHETSAPTQAPNELLWCSTLQFSITITWVYLHLHASEMCPWWTGI